MNKLIISVVVTFVNAATKNFDNALISTIILCQRCLLFKNSCENSSNIQMPIIHVRIVQIGQLRCFSTSTFFVNIKKYQNCPILTLFQ